MTPFFVESIAMLGPGLPDWQTSIDMLRNPVRFAPGAAPGITTAPAKANGRRRTTPVIRLALQVTDQLARDSSLDLSKATSIFASSSGDLQVLDKVCTSLTEEDPPVSPKQFQNIVHNAAGGFWSLEAGAKGTTTSLSARESSFTAGLIEAYTCLIDVDAPVVFACYDHPAPPLLDRYLPIPTPFASAMVLTREPTSNSRFALACDIHPEQPETVMIDHPELERLRTTHTAARGLPLFHTMANGGGRVCLSYIGPRSLVIDVDPIHQ
ncbi:hypothetical protein L861_17245 [Litchfieldella anticariensis FP35 = DSM 16096]|uniref:Beta-ketoacyl synthase-like N-terminal domain-containing protein n=1 Tax=Litchfieldella anticariensis (strain DSM 16096 / CECT 5854 / CIP 108499 / LMG 22089 / FP35) TaxID=1121939 RepID=S2KS05_LITA3|nr:beta-ketoacyl synthase chain length factor [Halomonas anticariensis]EPC03288.1 hypothetical protein L861_17245 [Halomonas anticariensis FP35 = DSM 16096]